MKSVSSGVERQKRIAAVAASLAFAFPAITQACPIGGCVQETSNNEICSAQCLGDGYTISVIQKVDGGPSLPSECNFVSPTGQYLIVEGSVQQLNFSSSEYPGQVPANLSQNISSVQFMSLGENEIQCDAWGNELYHPYYRVTFAIVQGVRACIPAREEDFDCGSASEMAQKYNARRPNQSYAPLPACRDDNCAVASSGDGMDSGAQDCHGGGRGNNPDNPDCWEIGGPELPIGRPKPVFTDCIDGNGNEDVDCIALHQKDPGGAIHLRKDMPPDGAVQNGGSTGVDRHPFNGRVFGAQPIGGQPRGAGGDANVGAGVSAGNRVLKGTNAPDDRGTTGAGAATGGNPGRSPLK